LVGVKDNAAITNRAWAVLANEVEVAFTSLVGVKVKVGVNDGVWVGVLLGVRVGVNVAVGVFDGV
jgi:hypothetical protein